MSESNGSTRRAKFSRRSFGKQAVAAAVTAGASRSAGAAETTPETQEIDARMANILRLYGDRLSDDQRKLLRRVLTENERMLARVRTFSLENADPPASVLKLFPAAERPQPARPAARRK